MGSSPGHQQLNSECLRTIGSGTGVSHPGPFLLSFFAQFRIVCQVKKGGGGWSFQGEGAIAPGMGKGEAMGMESITTVPR